MPGSGATVVCEPTDWGKAMMDVSQPSAGTSLAWPAGQPALAQKYPDHTIRLISPKPGRRANDTIARIIAARMAELLGPRSSSIIAAAQAGKSRRFGRSRRAGRLHAVGRLSVDALVCTGHGREA